MEKQKKQKQIVQQQLKQPSDLATTTATDETNTSTSKTKQGLVANDDGIVILQTNPKKRQKRQRTVT